MMLIEGFRSLGYESDMEFGMVTLSYHSTMRKGISRPIDFIRTIRFKNGIIAVSFIDVCKVLNDYSLYTTAFNKKIKSKKIDARKDMIKVNNDNIVYGYASALHLSVKATQWYIGVRTLCNLLGLSYHKLLPEIYKFLLDDESHPIHISSSLGVSVTLV